jgi:hypothetical protein
LVGIYAETSPCIVSIIGKAVKEPPDFNTVGIFIFLKDHNENKVL